MQFLNLGIGKKVTIGIGCVIILYLGASFQYHRTLTSTLSSFNFFLYEDKEMKDASHQIQLEVLLLQRTKATFLDTLNIDLSEEFHSKSENIIQKINQVIRIESEAGHSEDIAHLETILKLIKDYQSSFNEAVDVNRKRGLNFESGIREKLRNVIHDLENKTRKLSNVQILYLTLRRHEKDYLLRLLPKYAIKVNSTLDLLKEEVEKTPKRKLNKASKKELINNINQYQTDFRTLVGLNDKIHSIKNMMSEYDSKIESSLLSYINEIDKDQEELKSTIISRIERNIWIPLIFVLLATFFAVIISFFIVRSILRQIGGEPHLIVGIAQEVANGKIDQHFQSTYQESTGIFQSIRKMVSNLNQVISQISTSADLVEIGSQEISSASEAISSSASQQAASIEEISSSIEELSSQTRSNADNAQEASDLASESKNKAQGGNRQMKEMVHSMNEINKASENISAIIKAIDEIAFQTNVLAINAAVEAARAGAQGKGFGVVAKEVRNLAQRSAKAAKETSGMIQDSIKKINAGVTTAGETAQALADIVLSSEQTADLINEIAASSNEQSIGIQEITAGINQLNHVTQENSCISEEFASKSIELTQQAQDLKKLVAEFVLRKKMKKGIRKSSSARKSKSKKAHENKVALLPAPKKGIPLDMSQSFPDDLDDDFTRY